MEWPNHPGWLALAGGIEIEQDDRIFALRVIDCGELVVNSGQIVFIDPFIHFSTWAHFDEPSLRVPRGRYRVQVTQADVSGERDWSHIRNAYATLTLADRAEVERTPFGHGHNCDLIRSTGGENGYQIGVDAGTASFLDPSGVNRDLPIGANIEDLTCPDFVEPDVDAFETLDAWRTAHRAAWMADPCHSQLVRDEDWWHEQVFGFDEESHPGWLQALDDPKHLADYVANQPLPSAPHGENVVLFSSGWGDGSYPVVGGYDEAGELVRVHIDFGIVNPRSPFWLGRPPGYDDQSTTPAE